MKRIATKTSAASRPSSRPKKLTLHVNAQTAQAHVPMLKKHLVAAHARLRPALQEMSLAIVGNQKMAELHEQFMQIPGPTDVLTFELDHDPKGRVIAGEVVICAPVARKQAKIDDRPVEHELLLYALHGMLHLCGFDDRTASAFKAMHAKEDELLSRLKIGPVFHSMPRPTAHTGASGTRASKTRGRGK